MMMRAMKSARRAGAVHVINVPRSALVAEVTAAAEAAGLSFEGFRKLGEQDELENDELSDLWLLTAPALVSDDHRSA